MSLTTVRTARGRRASMIPSIHSIAPTSIKCVIVGDENIGKTCFLNSYVNPEQPMEREYIPTVFDTFSVIREHNGEMINLGLYDTSGGDKNKIMRLDTYSQTNVFVVAFSIDDRRSFENVKRYWHKEIKHFGSIGLKNEVPVMLVGMKADTRNFAPIQGKAKKLLGQDDVLKLNESKTYSFANTVSQVRRNSNPRKHSFASTAERVRHQLREGKKKTVGISQGIELCKDIGATCYMECSSSNKTGIEEVFSEVIRLGFTECQKE